MTESNSWKDAREQAIQKKGPGCYLCGRTMEERSQDISVHHINGDDNDHRVDNLLPVCQSCHLNIHRKPEGKFKKWHVKLPKESRYTPRVEDDKNRGPDGDYVIVSVGYTARQAIPKDLEYNDTLRFDSKEKLEETVEEWNEMVPGTLYTKEAHPGTRNKKVTHTICRQRNY